MTCTNPLTAWKSGFHPSGKQKLVFKYPGGKVEKQLVPCGKCVSCKLDYAREWATRLVHEAQTAQLCCFLTLTISDKAMVRKGFIAAGQYHPPFSVYRRSIQLFIKRLRKYLATQNDGVHQKIKYFACGEYGDRRGRPHYHMCLFGFDFPDKQYWQTSATGEVLYRSDLLESLWSNPKTGESYGFSSIGEVTFQSAGYVARYTLKKTKDKKKYEHIDNFNEETGEIEWTTVAPEFITMSKGIGLDWYNKYAMDTDKDYLTIDFDKRTKVPRYYDKQRERRDPESLERIKEKREIEAKERQKEDTRGKRRQRNTVKLTQNKMLKRGFENE